MKGEWGLPVVGYLPFMNRKITKTFGKLQKKYGNIFCLKFGSRIFIVLSDYNLIKQTFQKPEFSGRPSFYNLNVVRTNNHLGIILSNGIQWSTNRKFALRTLRDFGFGKTPILDEIILTEARLLIQDLRQNVDKPIEIEWNINVAVLNVIFSLLASRRFDVSDKEIKDFTKHLNENVEDMEGPLALFSIFPWMVSIVPKYVKYKWMGLARIVGKREKILDLLKKFIKEHRESLDQNNPRDYVDKYLIECESQKDNPEFSHCGELDLLINMYDFFIAGSETTSSIIRWFFLYMSKFPEVQKRVQKEIDEIVPKGQLPSLYDKDKKCFILLYNFNGSIVIPNIETCHKDPKYWKHPNTFSIDNFLDEDGKFIRNKEGYLPFGLGRRQCLGESLAKMELFLFIGSILQNFQILEPDGQNVSLQPLDTTNILNMAPKFEVILKNRN
ncbi:Cytochrome P450 [Armadillidium nasatum]|uniref:Cytochrome P450 n=1 Tax=Armadillidium nasatum TaxID=96803 RepID=A0A5N5TFU5_9CRUS|nr:Cytochrome P450 [Armadillidium nasatum]